MAKGWAVAAIWAFASVEAAVEIGDNIRAVVGIVGTIMCALIAISYVIGGHRA